MQIAQNELSMGHWKLGFGSHRNISRKEEMSHGQSPRWRRVVEITFSSKVAILLC